MLARAPTAAGPSGVQLPLGRPAEARPSGSAPRPTSARLFSSVRVEQRTATRRPERNGPAPPSVPGIGSASPPAERAPGGQVSPLPPRRPRARQSHHRRGKATDRSRPDGVLDSFRARRARAGRRASAGRPTVHDPHSRPTRTTSSRPRGRRDPRVEMSSPAPPAPSARPQRRRPGARRIPSAPGYPSISSVRRRGGGGVPPRPSAGSARTGAHHARGATSQPSTNHQLHRQDGRRGLKP